MEEESEDSLDLLLDTLCNAFGGIILITLLIALMSQEANNAPVVPVSFKTQWLLEQQEISRIENELIIEESIGENLEEKVEGEDLNQAAESISEKQKLLRQKQTIIENLESLGKEFASIPTNSTNLAVDLQNQLESLTELNEENTKLKSELQNEIKDIESKLSDVQNGISSSKSGRTQTLRLPKEKGSSTKKYIWVVVKHGRIYPINHPNLKEIFNSVMVGQRAMKFIPRYGRGLDVISNQAGTISYLRKIDARNEYLAFEVFANDECFRVLNKAKQLAASMGIGYTWHPLENDLILTTEGGRGAGSEL
jgi:hypothetical protein